MAKRAVLIGCNYKGTKAELKGCINDVWRMHKCLTNIYEFSEKDIIVLIDTDHSYTQPTGKNIRLALSKLVQSAKAGDILFVHFSGHGTRIPADMDKEDNTNYDECIVPTDMNLITDDDFRQFVDKIPRGCRITIVSDCCHSGGLIEATKEQIGDSTNDQGLQNPTSLFHFKNLFHRNMEDQDTIVKNRSLPLSTLTEILKQKSGKDNNDIEIGNLKHTLFHMFGEDASPKVKKFMKLLVRNKLQHRRSNENGAGIDSKVLLTVGLAPSGGRHKILGLIGDLAQQFFEQTMDEDEDHDKHKEKRGGSKKEEHAASIKRNILDCGILLSGCQSDQTSADASPNGNSEIAYGAFSNVILCIIEETNGAVTNRELVLMARTMLKRQGFSQKPGLYCSDHNVNAPFVC